jgi:hypothetical protein
MSGACHQACLEKWIKRGIRPITVVALSARNVLLIYLYVQLSGRADVLLRSWWYSSVRGRR